MNKNIILGDIFITVYIGTGLLSIGIFPELIWKAIHSIGVALSIFLLVKMNKTQAVGK